MEKLRISEGDISLGEPLRWDVFDEHGFLLLSKGHLIETYHQLEGLIERGLFVEATHLPEKVIYAAAKVKELPSVVRLLEQCKKQLEHLLFGLRVTENAQEKILALAGSVFHATDLNPNVALAYIVLNDEVDSYTIRHSIDTAIVSLLVAKAMKKPDEEILSVIAAALTMNLGMLRQHNAFQAKEDELTESDLQTIRKHPEESVRLLEQAGVSDKSWLSYVLHHHENEDGTGYPFGKHGKDCPQNGKLISLADQYCTGVTGRMYRKPMMPGAVLRNLFVESRRAVDTQLAPYFIQKLGIYPPGTLVRLHHGEIAVVTKKGKRPTTPVVHAYIGPRGAPLSFPIERDTAKDLYAVQGPVSPDDAPLPFAMQQIWGAEAAY